MEAKKEKRLNKHRKEKKYRNEFCLKKLMFFNFSFGLKLLCNYEKLLVASEIFCLFTLFSVNYNLGFVYTCIFLSIFFNDMCFRVQKLALMSIMIAQKNARKSVIYLFI